MSMTKERKAAVRKIQGKLRQFVRLFAPAVTKPLGKVLRDVTTLPGKSGSFSGNA